MVSENVIKIIDFLYNKNQNTSSSGDVVQELVISEEDLQKIVTTPSLHKQLLRWKGMTDNAFRGFITLTEVGIRYKDNDYMFDHEKNKEAKNVSIAIASLHQSGGIISGINYGDISISNDHLDKVIELLKISKVDDYKTMVKLFEEYKQNKDQNILKNISTVSAIGQLLVGMIQLGIPYFTK